ncbi:MAG TPA: ABC transporter substrate-binding protein [Acidimicrobiales bacterium]|nr:ABC transporter substrate-binding protein [Acidimicrobiales bacterium]
MAERIDRRSFLARGAVTGAGIVALGAGGGLLDACSSGSSSPTSTGTGTHPNGVSSAAPKTGGKLIFGVEAEEKGFDPTTGTFDTTGILYARTVYDPLAIIGADGTVQPYLAQSITPNPDYTVWTVVMRPGVVFHDGTPCDGAAVAYNFNAQKDSILTGPAVTNIASIAVTDPMTVKVTMHTPWVPFNYYLAGGIGGQIAFIAAPSMLKDTANGTMNPVGTGPFVNGGWVPNDHFTANKNPHYWRPGYPYLDTIQYKPIPDSDQLLNSLMSNSVDIIHTSASTVTKSLRGDSSLGYVDDSTHVAGEPDMACMLLNLSKPPFNNAQLRQAAAMAVSSAQYAQVIDLGVNPTSNGPFVSGSPFFAADGYPAYDPTKAKQLVQQVKSSGAPVSLTLNHVPDPFTTKIAQYLQNQLQLVGMTVTLSPVQQAQIINVALLGSFEAQVWRQFGAVDPDLNYIFWSPTQINSSFSINMARNVDSAMETALQKGRQTADPTARAAAYQQVASLMGKDIPYVWSDRTVWSIGAQPKVQNFNNPTTPAGGKGFGMITGAVWPTQIWLNS